MTESILDPQQHQRLIQDMTHVCKTANVLPAYVHKSMHGVCSEGEISWVKNFRAHQGAGTGLALVGVANPEARIMSIAGALLRNYVDARVLSVASVLALKDANSLPDCTVMLIPNLFMRSKGTGLPSWKIQIIYDLMLSRLTSNKPTVIYVEEMEALASEYGRVFADHIAQHYKTVEQ